MELWGRERGLSKEAQSESKAETQLFLLMQVLENTLKKLTKEQKYL